jgi:hypothetical protein
MLELIIAAGLLGGGIWYLKRRSDGDSSKMEPGRTDMPGAAPGTTAPSKWVSLLAEHVEVRSAPPSQEGSRILGYLPKGTGVFVTSPGGEWVGVVGADEHGNTLSGFVVRSAVGEQKDLRSTSGKRFPFEDETGTNPVNIHSMPSIGSAIVATIPPRSRLTFLAAENLGDEDVWLYVDYRGTRGWIGDD